MKIILASASLGRKKILENLGLKFEVLPADIDEEKITASNPITLRPFDRLRAQGDAELRRSIKLVKKIAKAKALAVAARILPIHTNTTNITNEFLIIAADSMVLFRGKTYGKPKDKVEAKKMLGMLSGQTHEFLTGLCVIDTNISKIYQRSAKSTVKFGKFTGKEIDDFIKIADVVSFAGGYTFELKGSEILRPKTTIFGSKSNMAGLPLEKLLPILKRFLPE